MVVDVLLFAGARDAVGQSAIAVQLPPGATVADLALAVATQYPSLARLAAIARFAVNHEYATATTVLRSGDEIALIPPVSGGSA